MTTTTEARWSELAALEPDWDSYGANPPTEKALRHARLFLGALKALAGASDPAVCPTPEGGICLEWFARNPEHPAGLMIEFDEDGELSAYAHVGTDEIETGKS